MNVQTVVVLGANSAGLLTALTLKRRLPQLAVQVIREPVAEMLSEHEGTTPSFPKTLFEDLQLKPGEFYREVEPVWKLGTRFVWGGRGEFYYPFSREYEHPPTEFSRGIGYYYTHECRTLGPASAFMAHDKAFSRRSDGLPQVSRHFGFHIEGAKLLIYLEKRCRENGVVLVEGSLGKAVRDGEQITELQLKSGQQLSADLFVDASGSRSELLSRVLAEPFVSYERTLFCDRVVIGGWARGEEVIHPYTTAETMEAGWCWQTEHEHWISRGYVYSSRFLSDKDATAELLRKSPQVSAPTLQSHSFRQGRAARNWVGNVVGIGDASGFIEPLESTRLHLACTQAKLLADVLADSFQDPTPSLLELYNESIAQEWDDIRDFLSVHYAFNTRLDTPFWCACREQVDLEGAARIVRYYRENGPSFLGASRLVRAANPFGLDGYFALLVCQGVAHEKPYRPSAGEQHMWRKRLALIESQALRALSVEVSLKALRSADWPGM